RVRPRRRRRTARGIPMAVNLAPMIDVAFLLLIFFLVTTTFERAEGILASDLPDASRAPAVALPISPIVIRLTQAGEGHEDFTIGIDRFEGVPQDFAALPAFLRQIQEHPGFDKQTPVVIVADNDVRWDHVVNCWNTALRAGYEKIAFAEP
ncbi:MAG: biopolymer transporter ExbD, partial [Phycisphaerae bacterium]